MKLHLEKVDGRTLQPDPGVKNKTKTKPTYELKKMVLKLELGLRLD